jgi:hypothetical protein
VQESVHGVQRPARATACEEQVVPRAFNDGFLRAESVRAQVGAQAFGGRAVSDHDGVFGQGVGFAQFEGRACDLRQVSAQLVRGVALRFARATRHDDGHKRLAPTA